MAQSKAVPETVTFRRPETAIPTPSPISGSQPKKSRSRSRVDSESGSHSLVGLDGGEKVNLSNGFRPNDLGQFYSKNPAGIQGKAVMRWVQQELIPAIALRHPGGSKSGFSAKPGPRQSNAEGIKCYEIRSFSNLIRYQRTGPFPDFRPCPDLGRNASRTCPRHLSTGRHRPGPRPCG